MNSVKSQASKNAETKRFNDNASRVLIGWGDEAIIGLFEHLGYECMATGKGTYCVPCPICKASTVLIGVNGSIFPIWWKCLSGRCPKEGDKHFKNLLGLVRACMDGNLGEAYKAIATYLGADCPFHITNLTDADVDAAIKAGPSEDTESNATEDIVPATKKTKYVFVVPNERLKTLFDNAGIHAVMGGISLPKDCFVYSLAEDDSWQWEYLTPDGTRSEAEAILKEAGVTPPPLL